MPNLNCMDMWWSSLLAILSEFLFGHCNGLLIAHTMKQSKTSLCENSRLIAHVVWSHRVIAFGLFDLTRHNDYMFHSDLMQNKSES